ncbi:MAG TPA: adenine phosphoribosyltransferase [Gemmatimonadales bacterium]
MPIDRIRALIRDVPDFPQAGIVFKDITPVLADAGAFQDVLDAMEARLRGRGFDRVVAIESRGFIFGATLADRLKIGFSPIRKLGKLPYKTHRVEYALEYGQGVLESHVDAVRAGEKVAVVDDLLATGGTAWGAAQLVQKQEARVGAFLFVVELAFLNGRKRLEGAGGPVETLISY